MVIGFDAKYVLAGDGGLAHYGLLALDALSTYCKRHDYILYTPDLKDGTASVNRLLSRGCIHLKSPHGATFTEKWRTGEGVLRAARRHKVTVYHGLATMLPSGIKNADIASVVTLGSMAHKHYPSAFSFLERYRINQHYKRVLSQADALVALSEYSKQEVVNFYGVDPERIKVILPSCELNFADDISDQVLAYLRSNYVLPERYILAPGDFDDRHNLTVVVKALAQLADKDICLVMVGRKNSYYEKLRRLADKLGVGDRVVRIKQVNPTDKPAIYRMATALVCASRYEIVSLSILRGLMVGLPIVAATGSCMEEYGGDAALYFSPDSPDELASALERAMGDQRQALAAACEVQKAKFAPQHFATQLCDLYQSLHDHLKTK